MGVEGVVVFAGSELVDGFGGGGCGVVVDEGMGTGAVDIDAGCGLAGWMGGGLMLGWLLPDRAGVD